MAPVEDGHISAVEQGGKAVTLLCVISRAGWGGAQGSAVGGEGVGLPFEKIRPAG